MTNIVGFALPYFRCRVAFLPLATQGYVTVTIVTYMQATPIVADNQLVYTVYTVYVLPPQFIKVERKIREGLTPLLWV